MPTKNSGFLKRSSFGPNGNFELALGTARGGFAHFWRDNDSPSLPWTGPQLFGSGPVSIPSLIQSEDGSLEVFACDRGRLAAYRRAVRWSGPSYFGSGVTANPAVIQTDDGDLHLVVPLAGGGFGYFQRPGDPEAPWGEMHVFGSADGHAQSVALIQSNFDDPGNLEIVAVVANSGPASLVHWWRSSSGVWNGPNPVASNDLPPESSPQGAPAFLQSTHGTRGDFEVVIPLSSGGFAHLRRDNDGADLHWNLLNTFGGGQFTSVSMLQSGFGSVGAGQLAAV